MKHKAVISALFNYSVIMNVLCQSFKMKLLALIIVLKQTVIITLHGIRSEKKQETVKFVFKIEWRVT